MVIHDGRSVIRLNINGDDYELSVRPSDVLLDVLREKLGLTGAKPGCKNGDCGACTVVIDDLPAKSCLMLACEAEGKKILTIEGLSGTACQKAFVEENAFQCGYCTSGFLMVCYSMQKEYPEMPEDYVIEEWLQSNICRCTSYAEISKAVENMYSARHT